MTIEFISQNAPATPNELRQLELAMGYPPPREYVDFLSLRNGGRVETNILQMTGGNECGVNAYLEVARVIQSKAILGDRLSQDAWPIADAEGGNYVCLRRETSGAWTVVFWDHELGEEIVLSDSFSTFLESLEKFDPEATKLQPGQVVSAWIDPDLLKDNE